MRPPRRQPTGEEAQTAQLIITSAARNDPETIKRLIEQNANPTAANGVGQTALHVACLWGHHECASVLIEAGAQMYLLHHAFVPKVNLRNTINGSTPLHFAAQESERGDQKGRLLCVKMLLAAGAERDIADYRGGKPYQMSGNPDVRVALGGPAEPSDESDDQEEEEDIQQLRQNFVGCTMQPSTRAWRL